MTKREYEVGLWFPWTGGPCPLPKGAKYKWRDGDDYHRGVLSPAVSNHWNWECRVHGDNLVSFCVTEYPPEPKRSGVFWLNLWETQSGIIHAEKCQSEEVAKITRSSGFGTSKLLAALGPIQWTEGEGLE